MFVYSEDIYITNKYCKDLETKAADAMNVAKQIENYVTTTRANEKLKGEVYDILLRNLEVYQYAFSKVAELCTTLANNIKAGNSSFLSYTYESPIGEPIDARKIPEYEDELAKKEAEKTYCEETVEEIKTDENGNTTKISHMRDAARAATLKTEIAEIKKIIDYLERLDDEASKAAGMVESIGVECSQFASNVNSIQVSIV